MTTAQFFSMASVRVPSANDVFKSKYSKTIRWSILAVLALTCLFVAWMPRYEPTPYILRESVIEIIEIEIIKDVVVEKNEPMIAPPIVREVEPVPPDYEKEGEFEEGKFWPIRNPGIPNYTPPTDDGFVASSANPRLVFQAKPKYPQIARMSQIEGTVIVKVLVGIQGDVEAAQVIQGVHPMLNRAAIEAAYKCRFEPGTQRTIPVQAWISVPYRFRLN